MNNLNIQQLERSLQCQFKKYFDLEEIEQLVREKKFVQRQSKLGGCTFLNLIVFNSKSLHDESLNGLTISLDKKYDIDIGLRV